MHGLDLDLVKTENSWNMPKILGVTGALLGQTTSQQDRTNLTMRKIGIDVASMTLSDATGILPKVRFSDLYFDFESLTNGSLVGSIRGRHDSTLQMRRLHCNSPAGGSRFAVDMTAQKLRRLILLVISIKSRVNLKRGHRVYPAIWN